MADTALSMKLARWRYRESAGDDRREHFGIILEDTPGAPAVAADGLHVDLYGYTSMVLAAAQQEHRNVVRLERELDELRSEVRLLRKSKK